MAQTLRTIAYVVASAVAMSAAIAIVQHYESKITAGTDELVARGTRLWEQALAEQQREHEVRRTLPWLLWDAYELTEQAAKRSAT